jgi:hypothetical protein
VIRPASVEVEVVERVRAWLARTLPRVEELDRAELTIRVRDTGHRDYSGGVAEGGVPLVSVEVSETADDADFTAPARELPPTEPPLPRDAREIAAAAYEASEPKNVTLTGTGELVGPCEANERVYPVPDPTCSVAVLGRGGP